MEEVRCTNCNRVFTVESEEVPSGIQEGHGFDCWCPLCEDGDCAVLTKSNYGCKDF
jgi:hypothetical protein